MILSFVSGQIFNPSIEYFKSNPQLLSFIFKFTLVISFNLFLSFVAELTTLGPVKRFKVFRSELTKVFWTIILVYFESFCFTQWMYTLAAQVKESERDRIKRL